MAPLVEVAAEIHIDDEDDTPAADSAQDPRLRADTPSGDGFLAPRLFGEDLDD